MNIIFIKVENNSNLNCCHNQIMVTNTRIQYITPPHLTSHMIWGNIHNSHHFDSKMVVNYFTIIHNRSSKFRPVCSDSVYSPVPAAAPDVVLQCCLAFKTVCDVIKRITSKGCLWRHNGGFSNKGFCDVIKLDPRHSNFKSGVIFITQQAQGDTPAPHSTALQLARAGISALIHVHFNMNKAKIGVKINDRVFGKEKRMRHT